MLVKKYLVAKRDGWRAIADDSVSPKYQTEIAATFAARTMIETWEGAGGRGEIWREDGDGSTLLVYASL